MYNYNYYIVFSNLPLPQSSLSENLHIAGEA